MRRISRRPNFFLQPWDRSGEAVRRPCGSKQWRTSAGSAGHTALCSSLPWFVRWPPRAWRGPLRLRLHKGMSPGQADVQRVRSVVPRCALRRGGSSLDPHQTLRLASLFSSPLPLPAPSLPLPHLRDTAAIVRSTVIRHFELERPFRQKSCQRPRASARPLPVLPSTLHHLTHLPLSLSHPFLFLPCRFL